MAPRPRREKTVKARVSDERKQDVQALALMFGDERNESLVVRNALDAYLRQTDVAALLAEGRRLLAAKRAEQAGSQAGPGPAASEPGSVAGEQGAAGSGSDPGPGDGL